MSIHNRVGIGGRYVDNTADPSRAIAYAEFCERMNTVGAFHSVEWECDDAFLVCGKRPSAGLMRHRLSPT
jgi:hypothetical protein